MLTNDDLQAIKEIVKGEVDPVKDQLGVVKRDVGSLKKDLQDVKKQVDTLEIKVELVSKKIDQSQIDTIESLSELMHTGYNLHEDRITKIEDQLKSPPTH